MVSIAFVDDSFPFTGHSLRESPLGGIQTATVSLAEAFVAQGHKVTVLGMVSEPVDVFGVSYRPISSARKETFDLVIANCAPKLFRYAKGKKRALWLHGPARYMRKPRHFLPYFRYRPTLIFLGTYHDTTWPKWLPRCLSTIIPHGVGSPFIDSDPISTTPPPRAIFISNPRRGLDWILNVWMKHIHAVMPTATLHVYAGRSNYGNRPDEKLEAALALVEKYANLGVTRHDPLPKIPLAEALGQSRAMLYRGDPGETFCFAAAEAQAMGVPLVTAGVGALAERVEDGVTGFLAPEPEKFAKAALQLLRDDTLWRQQHEAALARRAQNTWERIASLWIQFFFDAK